MGSSGAGQEMFSFSFDTEILSFFWRAADQGPRFVEDGTDQILSQISVLVPEAPPDLVQSPAALFRLLLAPAAPHQARTGLLSWLQYSVVTTGIVAAVGVGSYCTYQCLQRLRRTKSPLGTRAGGVGPVRRRSRSASETQSCDTSPWTNEQKVLVWSEANSSPRRPVSLEPPPRPSARPRLRRQLLSEDDPQSDDDDDASIELQYFGPTDGAFETDDEEGAEDGALQLEPLALDDPPLSPTDSAYTSEYETLPIPRGVPDFNNED